MKGTIGSCCWVLEQQHGQPGALHQRLAMGPVVLALVQKHFMTGWDALVRAEGRAACGTTLCPSAGYDLKATGSCMPSAWHVVAQLHTTLIKYSRQVAGGQHGFRTKGGAAVLSLLPFYVNAYI